MVAILYMVIGLSLGWIVREVFYVPHDFHYGILVVSFSWASLGRVADCRWLFSRIGVCYARLQVGRMLIDRKPADRCNPNGSERRTI
jgi:hypothetical protein